MLVVGVEATPEGEPDPGGPGASVLRRAGGRALRGP